MKSTSKNIYFDFRNRKFELELQSSTCYVSLTTEFAVTYNRLGIPTDILFATCMRIVFPELPAADLGGFSSKDYWRTPLGNCPYVNEKKQIMTGEFSIDVEEDTWVLLKYTTTPKNETEYIDILLITTPEASKIVSFISESRASRSSEPLNRGDGVIRGEARTFDDTNVSPRTESGL